MGIMQGEMNIFQKKSNKCKFYKKNLRLIAEITLLLQSF